MADYLNKEMLDKTLYDLLAKFPAVHPTKGEVTAVEESQVRYIISKLPVWDVEEVVRCKNCKHCTAYKAEKRFNLKLFYCNEHDRGVSPDDYCNRGVT